MSTDTSTQTSAVQKLTEEQEIQALRAAHQFFANFDRVPGFLASQWSQALDAVAVVANSLIAKTGATSDTRADADVETGASLTN